MSKSIALPKTTFYPKLNIPILPRRYQELIIDEETASLLFDILIRACPYATKQSNWDKIPPKASLISIALWELMYKTKNTIDMATLKLTYDMAISFIEDTLLPTSSSIDEDEQSAVYKKMTETDNGIFGPFDDSNYYILPAMDGMVETYLLDVKQYTIEDMDNRCLRLEILYSLYTIAQHLKQIETDDDAYNATLNRIFQKTQRAKYNMIVRFDHVNMSKTDLKEIAAINNIYIRFRRGELDKMRYPIVN